MKNDTVSVVLNISLCQALREAVCLHQVMESFEAGLALSPSLQVWRVRLKEVNDHPRSQACCFSEEASVGRTQAQARARGHVCLLLSSEPASLLERLLCQWYSERNARSLLVG